MSIQLKEGDGMMLMKDVLKQHAEELGDYQAIVYHDVEWTYRTFYNEVTCLAGYLQSLPLQKGDFVGLLMENTDQFPIAYFAIQFAGYVVMPINTKLAPPEIAYILNHSEVKVLIMDEVFQETYEKTEYICQQVIMTNDLHNLALMAPQYRDVTMNPSDVAVILYTSGTTGHPKGVMLTHQNIYMTAELWSEPMELTSEDRLFICTPLFHSAGAHVFMVPCFYVGATLIIEKAFSPKQILQQLSDTKATFFFGVPAMYTLILNHDLDESHDVSSLRLFGYGAAPMPYELIRRLKEAFPNVKVQNFYGQTENSPAATTLLDDDALTKVGSVGRPLAHTEIRIDDGAGGALPNGYVGEIVVKGPQLMKGYLKNPEETMMALRDGWLYTGDLGRLDEDGYLYIVDRKKDMIIRSGENIYPIEIEEVLYQMPALFEAAVVGVPHPVYGEVPKAYVRVKEGNTVSEEEILAYCATQLATYKLPYEIEFIEELPRNASGKVLKHVLRH